jgi:hypothetical protein
MHVMQMTVAAIVDVIAVANGCVPDLEGRSELSQAQGSC